MVLLLGQESAFIEVTDTKGIYIQGNEVVKLSQYADDTTALLTDMSRFLIYLTYFYCLESALVSKINHAKSEMQWLGSMRHTI